jgi:outer membrane usher protein FimD/PapC
MTPIFPVIELLDRLAIAEVKFQRTSANTEELEWYRQQSKSYDMTLVSQQFEQLKIIHNKIWDLESERKAGVEQCLSLEEIGRRAIAIRDFNNQRIRLKNNMAELMLCPVREIKQDHLSQ